MNDIRTDKNEALLRSIAAQSGQKLIELKACKKTASFTILLERDQTAACKYVIGTIYACDLELTKKRKWICWSTGDYIREEDRAREIFKERSKL